MIMQFRSGFFRKKRHGFAAIQLQPARRAMGYFRIRNTSEMAHILTDSLTGLLDVHPENSAPTDRSHHRVLVVVDSPCITPELTTAIGSVVSSQPVAFRVLLRVPAIAASLMACVPGDGAPPAMALYPALDRERHESSDAALKEILDLIANRQAFGSGTTIDGPLLGAVQRALNHAHFHQILVSSEPRWIERLMRMDIAHQLSRALRREIVHCEQPRY
jgi:hypothetical protein